jgi:hypothetical protein
MPEDATPLRTHANLLVLGLDVVPDKHIHLVPNIQILSYEDGERDPRKDFYIHLQYKL